ncbi:MAG: hypothetical protein JKY70_04240 [Mucilaginibacter sp.]|nr:hypothetical protein [Mucilaginibacter sp.]
MYNKLLPVLMLAVCLLACKKNNGACSTQMCDASFAFIGVQFTNSAGDPIEVTGLKVVNIRTNKQLELPPPPETLIYAPGYVFIVSDQNKAEFSAAGDQVKVTAQSTLTGRTKSFTLKISGGCNCHVAKVSGPDKLVID